MTNVLGPVLTAAVVATVLGAPAAQAAGPGPQGPSAVSTSGERTAALGMLSPVYRGGARCVRTCSVGSFAPLPERAPSPASTLS
ncbi:hypothetical protein [Streptomyces sp. VRA16 Mangrove soil]|uniref:hypothetical protein n=1 Tax=Streptomyces sp. VRA16 Mangrove soil TaxID=2817434 RepID=UPI001A9F3F21|nr:hypothetical protein [Streptomyces sp. VRA16 Mangrove soil]MBO1337890.1 hypothetical protein [Streptomyces sp. VRA16 Mangrove soil]